VQAGAGAVEASFSYRLMAKRKDIDEVCLEKVELPSRSSHIPPDSSKHAGRRECEATPLTRNAV
jgi:hypothetical protein